MNQVLIELKQKLHQIEQLILDKNDVLYFDYPLHLNVGDLLIYAGTEQFFKDYHINIRLRRCLQDFDVKEAKKYINKNTTILCHGGGNFGDIYPLIQKMREDIVQAFPHNRIILLPQTAYFSNPQEMLNSANLFSHHKDLHLFARDISTFELMKKHFSHYCYLSPDMAHQLYGVLPIQSKTQENNQRTLYFLRKDIEKSHVESEIQKNLSDLTHVKDWSDILSKSDISFELWYGRAARMANKLRLPFIKNKISQDWYEHSLDIIKHCQAVFFEYDQVITTRLHGHIFCCLLGISNQVCDNSYGKNSGYYQQWTNGIDYAKLYQSN